VSVVLADLLQSGGGARLSSHASWLALTRIAAGVAASASAGGGDGAAARHGAEALASLSAHASYARGFKGII